MRTGSRATKQALTPRVYVAIVAYVVLIAKLVLLNWIDNGIWIEGAGVQRFTEIALLSRLGLFAPGVDLLHSGYAVSVHLLSALLHIDGMWPIAVLQSALFSYGVWYFAESLQRTRIAWATVPVAYLLLLNPPLSLATLELGPDGVVAALVMCALGQLVRDLATTADRRTPWRLLKGAAFLGLAAFITPPVAVGAVAALLAWASARGNREQAISIGSAALALLLALPLLMLARNQIANNSAALPVFSVEGQSVATAGQAGTDGSRCGIGTLDVVSLNTDKYRCLLAWYHEVSASTSEAAVPNGTAFWAPWIGPLSEQGFQENPWSALHPLNGLGDSADPDTLLGSPLATVVSWIWLLGSMLAVIAGGAALRGLGDLERELSTITAWLVLGTWMVGILTSANASSRLPVMGAALMLQVVGWRYLTTRGRTSDRDPFVIL